MSRYKEEYEQAITAGSEKSRRQISNQLTNALISHAEKNMLEFSWTFTFGMIRDRVEKYYCDNYARSNNVVTPPPISKSPPSGLSISLNKYEEEVRRSREAKRRAHSGDILWTRSEGRKAGAK